MFSVFVLLYFLGTIGYLMNQDTESEDYVESPETPTNQARSQSLRVGVMCEDHIVCYSTTHYIDANFFCFRDADLVEKYCGSDSDG